MTRGAGGWLAGALAAALLSACAVFADPGRVAPGTPVAGVVEQLGRPTARYPAAGSAAFLNDVREALAEAFLNVFDDLRLHQVHAGVGEEAEAGLFADAAKLPFAGKLHHAVGDGEALGGAHQGDGVAGLPVEAGQIAVIGVYQGVAVGKEEGFIYFPL